MRTIIHPRDTIGYHGIRAPLRAPGTVFRYTVSGRGTFPSDMLRYDDAAAASDADAALMGGSRDLRQINITGQGCTPARWSSFGWSVHPEVLEVRP